MEESSRASRHRRRALARLAEAQGNLCFYCKQPMFLPDPNRRYENHALNFDEAASYDHVIPKNKGGRGGDNLVVAHRKCNSEKEDRIPTDEELNDLIELNKKRQHLFTCDHGKISPSTFFEVSEATIILAKTLNEIETEDANKIRHAVCQSINLYNNAIKSLDIIKDTDRWYQRAEIAKAKHLKNVNSNHRMRNVKHLVENVIESIFRNRCQRRMTKETLCIVPITQKTLDG